MAVSQAAQALIAKGVDMIDFGLGEPDFATPAHIAEVAYAAAWAGDTLHIAAAGFRISTATPDAMRTEAIARIAMAIAKLVFAREPA
jgi:aspartate aminotransferase